MRRSLAVVRWLQIGTAAAGISLGFAAAPAIASADDGGAVSASGRQAEHSPRVGTTNRGPGRTNRITRVDQKLRSESPQSRDPRGTARSVQTIRPQPSALPKANPVITVVAGLLGVFGLNKPVAPRDAFGAAVWSLVREVERHNGLVPLWGTSTVSRDDVTGIVVGSTGFTVPAGLPLSYTVTVAPLFGKVTVDKTGAYIYTPDGEPATDLFTVTASDGLAATSATITVPLVPKTSVTTTELPKTYDLHAIVVSPDGKRLYVTNKADAGNGQGTVVVLDAATKDVIATIDAGVFPEAAVLSPDGKHLYVADWNQDSNSFPIGVNGSVSVVDTTTNTISSTVEVGHGPRSMALTSDGSRLYVVNQYDNTLSVIDTATRTVTATIPVGYWPWAVAVSPDGGTAYVGDSNALVSVIDTGASAVIKTIEVGPRPRASSGFWGGFSSWDVALAVSPDGSALYVINDSSSGSQLLTVDMLTRSVVGSVWINTDPTALAVSPDGRTVWISNCQNEGAPTGCTPKVWAVDAATRIVVGTIVVGDTRWNFPPNSIAISADGRHVYTANSVYGWPPESNSQSISDITVR